MSEPIKILIVDDHSIVRQGLHTIMRALPGMAFVGEASNGREAFEQCQLVQPNVVLMDLIMPEVDGVTATEMIKQTYPAIHVIVLTTFADANLVVRAVQAGADGYLLKDIEMHELARAITIVNSGQPYLHPEATRHLVQATTRPEQPPERLTTREQEVLLLVARGMTNRQIADELAISEKTVSVHVSNTLSKLGLTSRTQAALYAARAGLIQIEN